MRRKAGTCLTCGGPTVGRLTPKCVPCQAECDRLWEEALATAPPGADLDWEIGTGMGIDLFVAMTRRAERERTAEVGG